MNSETPAGGNIATPGVAAPKDDYQQYSLITEPPASALPATPPAKEAPPVPATKTDLLFSLLWCLLGYGFIYLFTTDWQPALTVYTPVYAGAVLVYVYKSGLRPPAESWLWLGILLCIGLPLPYYSLFGVVQLFALLGTAAYFTLSTAGVLLQGKTSSWLLLDLLNAWIVVPLGNFTNHFQVLSGGIRTTKPGRNLLTVGLGLIIALPLMAIILPLLSGADQAFFNLLADASGWVQRDFGMVLLRIVLSLPVTAFLYGLIHGAIYRRRTAQYSRAGVYEVKGNLRILPGLAMGTALTVVCGVYVLFMALQFNYFFSAFRGVLPEGFSYSGFARQGFFELCQIAGFNVFILLFTYVFTKSSDGSSKLLRRLTLALSGLSLLLIVTAGSKMGLYIAAHGLTQKRVLTSVFMLWLAFVFVLIILRQFRPVPLVRLAVMVGAVLFSILCVLDVNVLIDSYNLAGGYLETGIEYAGGFAA